MRIKKLYPGGMGKAFNVSYDDGILQDVRFIELLNRYGLKGTFNLNSGLLKSGFEWTHECGMTIKRLPEDMIRQLYEGHEIASHTYTHPYMETLTKQDILGQLAADKFFLEKISGREVAGFAVPFMYYSDLIAACVRECGFEYARCSEESKNYSIPEDYYWWRGGKFHWSEDLEEYVDGFLKTDQELALCQIVGHSYDLDVYQMWDRMEAIFSSISSDPDIWPATHIELVRYLRRMEKAEISEEMILNGSDGELWFNIKGEVKVLQPNERVELK